MKEREPERNESTDDAVWLDLVSRLENMPADETHGGRNAPGGSGAAGSGTAGGADLTGSGPAPAGGALPPSTGSGQPQGDNAASGTAASGEAASDKAASTDAAPDAGEGPKAAGRADAGTEDPPRGPIPRSPAERTRAIFENQPFKPVPPRGPRDYDEPEELESEGEFVPPEPPPFSTGEPLVVLAWIGTLGGPLLLLLFAMFWRGAPVAVVLGVIALFGAAAAYLLFRLPQHRDDDGAEV